MQEVNGSRPLSSTNVNPHPASDCGIFVFASECPDFSHARGQRLRPLSFTKTNSYPARDCAIFVRLLKGQSFRFDGQSDSLIAQNRRLSLRQQLGKWGAANLSGGLAKKRRQLRIMPTSRSGNLGLRLASGFYGMGFITLAFMIGATAKPADPIPYYLIGMAVGLLGGTLLWRAITGWKDEAWTSPHSAKPRIYTKDPPDSNFPYHS
jgi:hypothetical protein